MSCWALVPTKGFDRGKSRLAAALPPSERSRLAREMFEHVIDVLRASATVDEIAVVSDSARTRRRAEHLGAVPLADAEGSEGLASVVDAAVAELKLRGATRVIVCMSDLPELGDEDVAVVSRRLDEFDVVLGPDLSDRGTNLIGMKPAAALPSCLGHEDSLRRHRERARTLGLEVHVERRPGIAFDVDHPGDLDRLRRR